MKRQEVQKFKMAAGPLSVPENYHLPLGLETSSDIAMPSLVKSLTPVNNNVEGFDIKVSSGVSVNDSDVIADGKSRGNGSTRVPSAEFVCHEVMSSSDLRCLEYQMDSSRVTSSPPMMAEDDIRVPPLHGDLFCNENSSDMLQTPKNLEGSPQNQSVDYAPTVRAPLDENLIRDDRILLNLLQSESLTMPGCPDYFKFLQKDIVPSMRKIVADWLLQVINPLLNQSKQI